MKVLIEIDENIMSAITDHNVTPSQVDEICEQILNAIPLNGTNGDVIKAVFKDMTSKVTDEGWIAVKKDRLQLWTDLRVRDIWWNADYKGVE